MTAFVRSTRITLEMIKIEHTLFALPFALLGAVLAANGLPAGRTVFWILVAMVGARSAAMGFNRLVDREYDSANPRTRSRALPAKLVSPRFVKIFVVLSSTLFVLAAGMLNRLTLMLSPVALASILLYSYSKRVTSYTHVILGWCLSIAPAGSWIAVRGSLDSGVPWLLSLAVISWTAGFDVIYSCQDVDFDRRAGLHSLPGRFGVAWALRIARIFHLFTFCCLVAVGFLARVNLLGITGLVLTAAFLIRQHLLVKPHDLSRLDQAFFTTNAYISVILFLTLGGDVVLRSI